MRLGIDLGGTKIAAVILADDGSVAWERRVETPRHDYEATLDALAALVSDAERAVGAECRVGVGMPGALSPATGLVKNANSTWLNGRRFQNDLEVRLGREVRCANDANCLAVSESQDGAVADAHVVFGAILGTGVGGGLVVGRSLLVGPNAIAGEWGHNPLPWPADGERPGPDCYCGRRGCIETFLSGPGLAADHRARTGETVSSERIVERAAAGEAASIQTLATWHGRLARALATVVNTVDPDAIVVGGGLSRIASLYDEVPRRWTEWVFSDRVDTRLVPAVHGDSSGVRGAAWLWPR
jgi:fructokinase